MLKNYFKLTIRNILKHQAQTLPIILSLIVAFTCCQMMLLYIDSSYEYDDFHTNKELIYRINYDETRRGQSNPRILPTTGPPTAAYVKERFTEIDNATVIRHSKGRIVNFEGEVYKENYLYYVQSDFLEIFTFKFLEGDPSSALDKPNDIILTKKIATKYFGDQNALGKVIKVDEDEIFMVSAVIDDIPSNSSFQFDFLLPFKAFRVPAGYPVTIDDWAWISFYTFIQVKPDTDIAALESALNNDLKKNFTSERAAMFDFKLQSLTDLYFGNIHNSDTPKGNIESVNLMLILALVILIISTFNFSNLYLTIATRRVSEIAVRKVSGASKSGLIVQLILESSTIALISAAIGLFLSYYLSTTIYDLLAIEQGYFLQKLSYLIVISLATASIIGILSGLLPSLMAVSQPIMSALKGQIRSVKSGNILRKTLVVVQFGVSAFVISFVLVLYYQNQFIKNRDLGFRKEGIVLMETYGNNLSRNYQALKTRVLQNPGVESISLSGETLDGDNGSVPVYLEGRNEEEVIPINILGIADDWLRTMNIRLIEGRYPNSLSKEDSAYAVVLNKQAVKNLGETPASIIGKKISIGDIVTDGYVIGVSEDFNFTSLHNIIEPVAMFTPRTNVDQVYLHLNSSNLVSLIDNIRNDSRAAMGNVPVSFKFLDDKLESLYAKEFRFSQLILVFSLLAILLAIIGLYGTTLYHIQSKLKSFGIRKVVGAGTGHLYLKFGMTFYLTIVLGLLLAIPAVNYFSQEWLNTFAYKIEFNLIRFYGLGAGLAFILAFIIIGIQFIKILKLNPVDVLKNE